MMMDSFATTTAKLFGDGCDVQTKGPGRKQTRQKLERQKGEQNPDTDTEREREREGGERDPTSRYPKDPINRYPKVPSYRYPTQ
jgi:hypothetical protein